MEVGQLGLVLEVGSWVRGEVHFFVLSLDYSKSLTFLLWCSVVWLREFLRSMICRVFSSIFSCILFRMISCMYYFVLFKVVIFL